MKPETVTITSSFQFTTDNLSKRFNREWIFRNLNLNFSSDNLYAITGPNGSGKSTLLQILWGQMPPTSGTIQYRQHEQVIAVEDVHKHIAIATPYMDIIDEFTLREQLEFHFRLRPARNGMAIPEMLDALQLTHASEKFIGNFSSGMRQRVKLGLAFFTEAQAIFLDEPGTNLDRQAFDWYLSRLKEIPPAVLIMIASNQPAEYPENAFKVDIMAYK